MDGLKVYLDELRGQPLQSVWIDIDLAMHPASASTINGKQSVRSFPGRL